MMSNTTKEPNQLIYEKSPYLLQHAYNPVHWYAWGEEAFAKAKKEDKPIFLSIGYSTCHWCHVMEHESFEDIEVANLLNQDFIAIKVDREERPDIDTIYMSVCQALTGAGGWPLTILMTQKQKPFYAGTYLPKYRRYDNMGLMALLSEVTHQWKTNRDQLLQTGEDITAYLEKQTQSYHESSVPSKKLLTTAISQFQLSFDQKNGGFGSAPKFPAPHNLLFLLQFFALEQDVDVLTMAEKSLVQMYRGGIFDHIGGGFSRYSTDEKWLIPHFEKMLYDNALLSMAYLEAYRLTKKPLYETVARRTLDYILDELTHEEGGFYCGQDADSDGVEGKYYAFTPDEIIEILGDHDGDQFCHWFGITPQGNFGGKSIPNLLNTEDYDSPLPCIKKFCETLFQYRLSRTKLHKDDKILNSWNALAIAAFSKASRILNEPRYLLAAQKATKFVHTYLTKPDGSLWVRWRDNHAAHTGKLDDYAFYAYALLELYDASFDVTHLQEAIGVAEKMVDLFRDEAQGGFYIYSVDAEQLISRPKELFDGAMPSGNSVVAVVLVRLAALTGAEIWQKHADQQLAFLAGNVQDYPLGHSFALLAMAQVLYPSSELVCTCSQEAPIQALHTFMNGFPVMPSVLVKTSNNEVALSKTVPFTDVYSLPEKGEYYYFCSNGACLSPVSQLTDIKNSHQLPFKDH